MGYSDHGTVGIPAGWDYQLDILVCHGGLGLSAIALLQRHDRIALIGRGTFSHRANLIAGLRRHGLGPSDVTDIVLSHSHHHHAINWVLFPEATICCAGST